MPSGTVHDDGGDQLHCQGVGTIKVTELYKGHRPLIEVYLPFKNSKKLDLKVGDRVDFDVLQTKSNVAELGGKLRYAKVTKTYYNVFSPGGKKLKNDRIKSARKKCKK